jgi:adenylate cyclase, class 1
VQNYKNMKLQSLKEFENKFRIFNKKKFSIFNEIASETHKKIFYIIPFLIHSNQFGLPGYREGKKVPMGIVNYSVDEKTMIIVKSVFPNWRYISHKNFKPFVQMFSVLGSCGSIGHNNKSDYDFWVVVKESDVSTEELENFKKKLEIIETWIAANFNMEVHFFVNDIFRLQKNLFANTEDEAFGSAFGILMKDEFFRASIHIAGKIPLWNVMPNDVSDEEYEETAKSAAQNGKYVDIGNISKIDKGEFYGATLFQVIKTLTSPFKSVMKMALLEKYLTIEDESVFLLSNKLKEKIFTAELDINILDSYVFLYNEIFDYYKDKSNKTVMSLIRLCFYLKVSPNLSAYKKSYDIPYKVKIFKDIINDWQWSDKLVENLDNFELWNFQKLYNLYNQIIQFISNSYNNISSSIDYKSFKTMLSNQDRLLIKRKISSFFSKEPDKIEKILSFHDNSYEKIIIFEPIRAETSNEVLWFLYKSKNFSDDIDKKVPLKNSTNPLELVVWSAINGVYNKYVSRIKFTSVEGRDTIIKIKYILQNLSGFLDFKKIHINNTDMLNSAIILKACMIVNFDSYDIDRLFTFDIIYLNSWGEIFLKHYHSSKSFLALIIQLLKNAQLKKIPFKDFMLIIFPENHDEYFIKLKKLLEIIYNYFLFEKFNYKMLNNLNCAKAFYFLFEGAYALITKDNIFKIKCFQNQEDIFIELHNIKKEFFDIRYDYIFTNDNNLIEHIIDSFKLSVIQLFVVHNYYNKISVIISNENNKLFVISKDIIKNDLKNYLLKLFAYLDSVTKVIRFINFSSLVHKAKNKIDIYFANYFAKKYSVEKASFDKVLNLDDKKLKFVNCVLVIEDINIFSLVFEKIKIEIKYIPNEPITILNNKVFSDWKKNSDKDNKIWITELNIKSIDMLQGKNYTTDYFINLKISIEEFLNAQL